MLAPDPSRRGATPSGIHKDAKTSMNPRLFRASKFDWILAVALIAMSVAVSFSLAGGSSQAGGSALLYYDGICAGTFDLSSDQVVSPELGSHDIRIEIRGGRIRMLDSDCPRKVCKHTGWISGRGQTIVCVPNKVLIEIRGNGTNSGCDAVSY